MAESPRVKVAHSWKRPIFHELLLWGLWIPHYPLKVMILLSSLWCRVSYPCRSVAAYRNCSKTVPETTPLEVVIRWRLKVSKALTKLHDS